jgi:tetratricopeptide (TPR) repeat protein
LSRSIHDTRRSAQKWWLEAKRTDDELDWERANAARANLHRQRLIKHRFRQQRDGAVRPVDPDDVAIEVERETEHVHHMVSEADLREVMRRLPPGRLDGLVRIELRFGGDGRSNDPTSPRDPYTGAPGSERLPGVYMPIVLGSYDDGALRLHAFVFANPVAPHVAMYLRLQALSTLVHELAHHFDSIFRTRGDRWRMDDRDKNETFAREVAFEHVTTCVVPHLAATYPDEHAALVAWLAEHAGVAFPIEMLVDDRSFKTWSVDSAFCLSVDEGDVALTRSFFADALHRAGRDDLATPIVDALLAESPELASAQLTRASIALRRGELDRAESIARAVLANSDWAPSAQLQLADILRARARWTELAELATNWLARGSLSTMRMHRVRASLGLARWDDAAADIEVMRARAKRPAAVLAAWLHFARGDHRKALAAANRVVKLGGAVGELRAELAAIRCESARALGELRRSWELSPEEIAELRTRGLERDLKSIA